MASSAADSSLGEQDTQRRASATSVTSSASGSPLKEGRPRSHSQDEEMQALRRRQESISFDYVAGLEQLSEDNMHAIRSLFNRHLHCTLAKDLSMATERDYYLSLAYAVRDHVMSGWFETQQTYYRTDPKVVFFFLPLCLSFSPLFSFSLSFSPSLSLSLSLTLSLFHSHSLSLFLSHALA